MENDMDENDRIKTTHDFIVKQLEGASEDLSARISSAYEVIGRVRNYIANLKNCLAQDDEARRVQFDEGYKLGQESAATRTVGTNEIPHEPEVAQQVSVGVGEVAGNATGENAERETRYPTLKEVVRDILARSKYSVDPGTLKFRVVDDGNGTHVVEFKMEVRLHPSGHLSCHAVERFKIYMHRYVENTVNEFDTAISDFHMIRVPLKSEDSSEWDSLD